MLRPIPGFCLLCGRKIFERTFIGPRISSMVLKCNHKDCPPKPRRKTMEKYMYTIPLSLFICGTVVAIPLGLLLAETVKFVWRWLGIGK